MIDPNDLRNQLNDIPLEQDPSRVIAWALIGILETLQRFLTQGIWININH